jgi:hypothetical protein
MVGLTLFPTALGPIWLRFAKPDSSKHKSATNVQKICISWILSWECYFAVLPISVLRIQDVYPGSRILIFTHPGSRISDPRSWILDPKTATKERGEKKLVVIPFHVATNFTKLEIILALKCWRKKFVPNFPRIIELFTKKIVKKLLKIWSWDPGSGIRDPGSEIRDPRSGIRDPGSGKNLFRIPDPGVKKAPDPGSVSATLAYIHEV